MGHFVFTISNSALQDWRSSPKRRRAWGKGWEGVFTLARGHSKSPIEPQDMASAQATWIPCVQDPLARKAMISVGVADPGWSDKDVELPVYKERSEQSMWYSSDPVGHLSIHSHHGERKYKCSNSSWEECVYWRLRSSGMRSRFPLLSQWGQQRWWLRVREFFEWRWEETKSWDQMQWHWLCIILLALSWAQEGERAYQSPGRAAPHISDQRGPIRPSAWSVSDRSMANMTQISRTPAWKSTSSTEMMLISSLESYWSTLGNMEAPGSPSAKCLSFTWSAEKLPIQSLNMAFSRMYVGVP